MTRIDRRADTIASYLEAVQQVISVMRSQIHKPLSLQDMADITALSPHHFNRIFHDVTGITPGHFLCALRLQTAIRLLLTTKLSITDICYEVGYESLGAFTTRFTQSVGLRPTLVRKLVQAESLNLNLLIDHMSNQSLLHSVVSDRGLTGQVSISNFFVGPIFVGLFASTLPQGRPIGCALLSSPGAYRITSIPDGYYYIFAAAFPYAEGILEYLLPNETTLRVGVGQTPVAVCDGRVSNCCADIALRPVSVIDPPVLSIIPILLSEHLNSKNWGG